MSTVRSYVLVATIAFVGLVIIALASIGSGPASQPRAFDVNPDEVSLASEEAPQSGMTIQTAAKKSKGKNIPGLCHKFTGKRTVYACAPARTPKGSPITRIYEDGGATYKNGSTYDSDDGVFR